jgi:hypothetical protein
MLKRGKLEQVENLDAKRSSNDIYFRVLVWTGMSYR